MIRVELGAVAKYSKNRVSVSKLNEANYVGVDNLLQNKQGKTISTYLPDKGTVAKYQEGDVLVGNIRPYLKKIWFATNSGGASGDILVFHNTQSDSLKNRYLYYVLSDDRFFHYDMQNAKGAKMPRGNKEAILKYHFVLPPLATQSHIVSILDNFDRLTSSMTEGLPKEIELRQKQYEYFREQLLTF